MSAPAANAFSLPVMTMAPMPSFASNVCSAAPSSCMSWGLSAFSCFGRLSVMTPTRPFCSTEMSSAMLPFRLGKRHGTGNVEAPPARVDVRECLDFLHGCGATHGELLVESHVVPLPVDLLLGELAQHARRDAGGERARRNARLGLDESERGHDRVLADLGVVVDHAIHADQRAAAHDAAMEDRAVPHGGFGARDRVLAGKAVQHAAVLDVRALLDHDAAEIAAQARARPDIGARRNDYIADQHRARMHEGARLDDRHDAVDGIDPWHGRILTPWHRSSSRSKQASRPSRSTAPRS